MDPCQIANYSFAFCHDLHKKRDRVVGDLYQPFSIVKSYEQ